MKDVKCADCDEYRDKSYFEEIKAYLNRKKDRVVFEEENDWNITFTVNNDIFIKHFYICYLDSFSPDLESTENLRQERPMHKYYWMSFTQENYPQQQRFVTIADMSWYFDEEDVIDAIKRFCRNWRK